MFSALLGSLAALAVHADALRVRAPAEVGMSPERLETIDRVVRRGIAAGGYPGAAVIVGRHGAIVYERAFGGLTWGPASPRVSTDATIYDVASLTKVVATTTAAMILYDEGRLRLDDKVSAYVPEFSGGLRDDVTVRLLLEHRSGLPAGRELWRRAKTPEAAKALVLSAPMAYSPGRGFLYSDLGADVLGWVVEAAAGEPLDRFVTRRVFAPLGMRNTGFLPADSLRARIAPTGTVGRGGRVMRGSVHDENAWALGGVAGHAGLFSTASDLAVFAQMMLNGGQYAGVRIVADSTVRLFTARAAGSRALGWEIANGEHGAGDYLDEHAYGHTGFTGTSLWIDPDRNLFVVLLTNRVYAARARRPSYVIADVRQDVADIAALAVLDDGFAIPTMPASFRADRAEGWTRRFTARPGRLAVPRSTAAKEVAERAAAAKARAARRAAAAKTAQARPGASPSRSAASAPPPKARSATGKALTAGPAAPRPIPTKKVAKR